MISTTTLKGIAAAAILVAGTFMAISAGAFDDGRTRKAGHAARNSSQAPLTIPAISQSETIVAQLRGTGPNNAQAKTNPQPATGQAAGSGMGMGGMGGGMATGGMGGMGMSGGMGMGGMGMGMGAMQAATSAQPIEWQRPSDDAPGWLAGGRATIAAIEKNREHLSKKVEDIQYNGAPLEQILAKLGDDLQIPFEVDLTSLDLAGVAADSPVTLNAPSCSLREVLRRLCEPLELTYVVTESSIKITTLDAAQADPAMRFYDLSYILPNSANTVTLVNVIQQSVDADDWLAAGGTNTINVVGSMMVVSAPETTHHRIEVLLQNISLMNPANAERLPPVAPYPIQLGVGMGGGGFF